jgi:hypothetical protein
MKKEILWIIGVCIAIFLWWVIHTPEIQWYEAKSYIGKHVTVIGPVISGDFNNSSNFVSMTMGIDTSTNSWESSLHILVPRENLSSQWNQKDLERGTIYKWTGMVQTGIVNSTWLLVDRNDN